MSDIKKQLKQLNESIFKTVSETVFQEENIAEPSAEKDSSKDTNNLDKELAQKEIAKLPAGEQLYFADSKEDEVWGYPLKYAFIGGDGKRFMNDTVYLFFLLMREKGMSPQAAAKELYPSSQIMNIKSYDNFLSMLTNVFIELNKTGEYAKIKSFRTVEELEGFLESEKIKRILIANNVFNDVVFKENKMAAISEFNTRAQNRKALISFNLNPKTDNDPKLRGLGFWQIQFLVRVMAQIPKYAYEEVFTYSTRFQGEASRILRDFYRAALKNQALILTGRLYINPNDVEFQIYLDNALDHVFDQLDKGMYDVERDNFGAWAFTVMKNHIINELRKPTEEFIQPEAASILDNAGYREISFTEPLETSSVKLNGFKNKEDFKKLYLDQSIENPRIDANSTYTYTFKSGSDLGEFLYDNGKNQSFIKLLTAGSRKRLRNIKILYAPKKSIGSDIQSGTTPPDEQIEKVTSVEKMDAIYEKLGKIFQGISGQSFLYQGGDVEGVKQETKKLKSKYDYSDIDLEPAFYRDYGKAAFALLTDKLQNEYFWAKEPSPEVLKSIIDKYKIDKKIAKQFFTKGGRANVHTNSAVGDIFYYTPSGSNKKEIFPELLDDFYVKSRWAGVQSGEGTIENTLARFTNKQEKAWLDEVSKAEEEGRVPNPIYTFRDVLLQKKGYENFYNKAIKPLERFKLNRDKKSTKEKGEVKSKVEDIKKSQQDAMVKSFLYKIVSDKISETERGYLSPEDWQKIAQEQHDTATIGKINKIRNQAALVALKRIDPNFSSGEYTAEDLVKWGPDYVDGIIKKLKNDPEAKTYYLHTVKNGLYDNLPKLKGFAKKITQIYIDKKYYQDVVNLVNTSASELTGYNLNILESELKKFQLFINELKENTFKKIL